METMMKSVFRPRQGWGPDARRGALSVTFDNLGEAAEIEMGMWADRPVGEHYTATFVPELIAALGDVKASYFIEGSNATLYPEAITQWHAAGHEVGLHAWRHESWAQCSPDRRRELLAMSIDAMDGLGIRPAGFRPPGGAFPLEAWGELKDAGLLYCSELGRPGVGAVEGIVSLPFEWRKVDAYMLEGLMGPMRVTLGDPEAPFGLAAWRAELESALASALAEGGHQTVIFHPAFLAESDEKLDVVRDLIASATRQDLWVAPAGDVARFVAAEMASAEPTLNRLKV